MGAPRERRRRRKNTTPLENNERLSDPFVIVHHHHSGRFAQTDSAPPARPPAENNIAAPPVGRLMMAPSAGGSATIAHFAQLPPIIDEINQIVGGPSFKTLACLCLALAPFVSSRLDSNPLVRFRDSGPVPTRPVHFSYRPRFCAERAWFCSARR